MVDIIKQEHSLNAEQKPNALFRFVHIYQDSVLMGFVLILVFVILLCGFCFYKADVRAPLSQLANLEKSLTEQQAKLVSLKSAKLDLSQMESSVKKLYAALPYDAELPELYLQISEITKKNKLTLASFNAELPKSEKNIVGKIQAVTMNLNLMGGDYFMLKKFVADATSSLRLMDIKALNYSPQTQSYVVILTAYYLPID
ncbi:type 4a pilus biogenesis protein PilO [Candidatus Falkowbacteria bacterium]|nr:type 4a pilus biogenesis protein PilO [Candidatus Falkowbacteria bacterium]